MNLKEIVIFLWLPLIILNEDKNRLLRVCDILKRNEVEYRIETFGGGNHATIFREI